MEHEEKYKKAEAWVKAKEDLGNKVIKTNRSVDNALYTFSEMGMLEDLSIKPELAIRIWAIVETAMRSGFPDELRM